jgi:hypothetical protein
MENLLFLKDLPKKDRKRKDITGKNGLRSKL